MDLRLRRVTALGDRFGDAVTQVLIEQAKSHRLQRPGRGRNLGEDVDAVLVGLDHPLEAAYLTLDAAQPLEIVVFVLGIPVHGALPPRTCLPRPVTIPRHRILMRRNATAIAAGRVTLSRASVDQLPPASAVPSTLSSASTPLGSGRHRPSDSTRYAGACDRLGPQLRHHPSIQSARR